MSRVSRWWTRIQTVMHSLQAQSESHLLPLRLGGYHLNINTL